MYPRFHVEQKNWQFCSSNNVLVLHLSISSFHLPLLVGKHVL